jgi:hypothetical protein
LVEAFPVGAAFLDCTAVKQRGGARELFPRRKDCHGGAFGAPLFDIVHRIIRGVTFADGSDGHVHSVFFIVLDVQGSVITAAFSIAIILTTYFCVSHQHGLFRR